ncbi:hypothetical protein BT93_D0422 [Corymbia citriodora subsp. variegata]|nr:hypothetical protein BT93_D0422 [Corymbia citriodora subsp. variegata]
MVAGILLFFAELFNVSFEVLLISTNYYMPYCLLCIMIKVAQEDLESLCLLERTQQDRPIILNEQQQDGFNDA